MDRCAVFIDAGYLFAQGSTLIAGTRLKRGETVLDEEKALTFFRDLAQQLTGVQLLRIYWYDGTSSGPTPAHVSLAYRRDLKVRLGIVNAFGEQKGVDSLIVSDLIDLARNRAMCDAVLLTGDEDLRVGVQKAQEAGVRVHLVGLEPAANNQSNLLRQEADTLHEISKSQVMAFLSQAPAPQAPAVVVAVVASAAGALSPLVATARQFAQALSTSDLNRSVAGPSVPQDIDRLLLRAGSTALGGSSLAENDKRSLRSEFKSACKLRVQTP